MWDNLVQAYQNLPQFRHLSASLLLLLLVWLIKLLIRRQIQSSDIPYDVKRKWLIEIRNWSSIIFIMGLGAIWATELQAFALSLVAIAAAVVIATKELIMCAMGGLLRASNHPFKVGDRIEVAGMRGDVIDSNLFVTKVLEIGPHGLTHQLSGRAVTIPNSVFLTQTVVNESFMQHYVLHVFTIPFKRTENWKKAESLLLEISNRNCKDFIEKARHTMEHMANKEGLDVPNVDPRVTFHFPKGEEIALVVRIPAPASRKGRIEYKITREFLNRFYEYPDEGHIEQEK